MKAHLGFREGDSGDRCKKNENKKKPGKIQLDLRKIQARKPRPAAVQYDANPDLRVDISVADPFRVHRRDRLQDGPHDALRFLQGKPAFVATLHRRAQIVQERAAAVFEPTGEAVKDRRK